MRDIGYFVGYEDGPLFHSVYLSAQGHRACLTRNQISVVARHLLAVGGDLKSRRSTSIIEKEIRDRHHPLRDFSRSLANQYLVPVE